MNIRETVESDISKLIDLMILADNRSSDWASARVRKYCRDTDKTILIAVEKDIFIGYAGIMEFNNETEETQKILGNQQLTNLTWIAVHPTYRGKKIGSKLLQEAIKWSLRKGKEGVWLDCREKVIPFYEKNGFRVQGQYNDGRKQRFVLTYIS